MTHISEQEFEELVSQALDSLPEKYVSRINNVAIVTENNPSPEQRQKLHLHNGNLLFGLYEGIPLTQRGNNYTFVVPDKITIFKDPIESVSHNHEDLKERVRHTLWHEIAHFFGLGHDAIYKRDGTTKN